MLFFDFLFVKCESKKIYMNIIKERRKKDIGKKNEHNFLSPCGKKFSFHTSEK